MQKSIRIVLKDADLSFAVKEITSAAFGSAGERCMAAAVVVVEEDVADELVNRLLQEANAITIGNGLEEDAFLGPVIRDGHKERTHGYIQSGIEQGRHLFVTDVKMMQQTVTVILSVQRFLTM